MEIFESVLVFILASIVLLLVIWGVYYSLNEVLKGNKPNRRQTDVLVIQQLLKDIADLKISNDQWKNLYNELRGEVHHD